MRIFKYIQKALIFTILLLPFRAQAAEITAIDFAGNVIGQVISTGLVINPDGENIGSITADSLIINQKGDVIGGVVPQGIAIGMDNRLLGKIHSDGVVRSLSGKTMGKALPSGLVVDITSEVIGTILYPGLIYSPKGDAIGRLTGGGEYTKLEGQRIGFVSANGYAYHRSGDDYVLDGRLMSSKMVVSINGRFLGSIAPTGNIVDFEGKEIGKIHANGYAYNSSGQIIGSVIATGYAFDQIGKYIGIVSYNGEVKRGNQVVAYYRADGSLVRANGDVVGFAVDIATTANDNNGHYLGYVIPGGMIARGNSIIGHVGAKGYVYDDDNNKIGELVKTGPVYDALARLKGQSMRNGRVISLNGNNIGFTRGKYVFDSNGTLIGGVTEGMIAIDNRQNIMSMSNIDSGVSAGTVNAKVSPFGYLFNAEGKVMGAGYPLSAIYGLEGTLYSYISPTGELYRQAPGAKLTSAGILLDKKGYLGAIVNPLYALGYNGQSLGYFANGNILLNKTGGVAYKIIPDGYAVATKDAVSPTVSPIEGFADSKIIALSIGGDLVGYANSEGIVTNLGGNNFGKVMYNNYIADGNNVVVGKLIGYEPVINEKCSAIGVVNGRGDIVNSRDVIIGRLLPNGQAISDVGSYIGYAVTNKGLIDYNGNFVGSVDAGNGIDLNGKMLGCVNRRGLIIAEDKSERYGVVIPAPVINFDNKVIGNVLANGQVFDENGKNLGYMQPNGNIVSVSKRDLGNVMNYQVAYSDDNNFLGMVNQKAQVIDDKGNVIAQVHFDGSVKRNGENIGYALYDFYVYDENFITYGYLTKDGTVLSMVGSKLGQIDRGFVTDRSGQVIARGNRDYIVRDSGNNPVGELQMDGTVVDIEGRNVGYLAEAGSVRNTDGVEIAIATPYQYYTIVQKEEPEFDIKIPHGERKRAKIVDANKEKQVSETTVKRQKLSNKIVGIALDPDGDIIGNIYDDDMVLDANGEHIGYVRPDGIVVDKNYNEIGVAEMKRANPNEMFMPPNAYGQGNAYGIGDKPSNVGAGGGYGQGERYDPARAQALQLAQNRRRASFPTGDLASANVVNENYSPSSFTGYEENGWPGQNRVISTWRVDMSQMILEDKGIPAVLARSVYASEGFSANIPITAIVERNVFAEEGRNIIIPAGSRVIGRVNGGGSNATNGGAVKIGIVWNRLIRPDGSQFTFSNAQTADAQGRSGAIGYLDQQLLKKYSLPLVTTALQTAANYLMASGDGSTSTTNSNGTTTTSDARSEAMQDGRKEFNDRMKEILDDIIKDKANIRSVTYIPAGTRIIIYPNQDLWLNSRELSAKESVDPSKRKRGPGLIDEAATEAEMQENANRNNNPTYNANYQNVQPARAPNNPNPQPSNINQNPAGYTPPAASQPVPSMDSGDSGDIPELL